MEIGLRSRFTEIKPIDKGWSENKKYCVADAAGTKYLFRITPVSRYETRKTLFTMLERVAALGVPMCVPVEFGARRQALISQPGSCAVILAVSRR